MLKPSPLKHKGSHTPYATEELYHEAKGGEVKESEEKNETSLVPSFLTPKDKSKTDDKFDDKHEKADSEIKDLKNATDNGMTDISVDGEDNSVYTVDHATGMWLKDGKGVKSDEVPAAHKDKYRAGLNPDISKNTVAQNMLLFNPSEEELEEYGEEGQEHLGKLLELNGRKKAHKNSSQKKGMITFKGQKIPSPEGLKTFDIPVQQSIGANGKIYIPKGTPEYQTHLKRQKEKQEYFDNLETIESDIESNPMLPYLRQANKDLNDPNKTPGAGKKPPKTEDIQKKAIELYKADKKVSERKARVSKYIEDNQGTLELTVPEFQKGEQKKIVASQNNLDEKHKQLILNMDATRNEFTKVDNRIQEVGNSFKTKAKDIDDEVKSIQKEIKSLGKDFDPQKATGKKLEKYKEIQARQEKLMEDSKAYNDAVGGAKKELDALYAERDAYASDYKGFLNTESNLVEQNGQLAEYQNIMGRNHHNLTAAGAWIASSGLEMASGIEGAAHSINPTTILANWAREEYGGDVSAMPDFVKGFVVTQGVQETLRNVKKEVVHKAAENLRNSVEEAPAFEDIESSEDVGMWMLNTGANFLPQLGLIATTGPASIYIMGTSAYGNEYDRRMRSNRLGKTNYTLGQIYMGAGIKGASEIVSERFTYGLYKKTYGVLPKPKIKAGFTDMFTKNIGRNIYRSGADKLGEGSSEVLAQIGGNAADVFVFGETKSLWQGTKGAFASGVLMEQMIKMPKLYSMASDGFTGKQYDRQLAENVEKSKEIEKILLKEDLDPKTKKSLEKKFVDLQVKNGEIMAKQVENMDMMTEGERQDLIDLDVQKFEAKQTIDAINEDASLKDSEKKTLITNLENDINDLGKKKNDIIEQYESPEQRLKKQKEFEDQVKTVKEKVAKFNKENNVQSGIGEAMGGKTKTGKVKVFETQEEQQAFFNDQITEQNAELKQEVEEAKKVIKDPNAPAEVKQTYRDFAKQAQRIIVENNADAKQNSREYGFMKSDKNGGFTMYLNKENAIATNGNINVAAHEFLHATLYKTLKSDQVLQNNLGEALAEYVTSDKGGLTEGFKQRIMPYIEDSAFGEEVLTVMSNSLMDGTQPMNDGFFTKVGDVFRRTWQRYGAGNIKFDTGKDVYNFIKDYNDSIEKGYNSKAIDRVMNKGAKGALLESQQSQVVDGQQKFSREASEKVQSIYEEQGEAGAFDIIDQFKPIVNKIVQKRSEAPNFDRQLLTDEIETGRRGIYDLIREYNPDSGVPLAAYINKYLPARAIEASKRVLGEEFTDDISERVDVAAEEVAEVETNIPKINKVVLADRLNVKDLVGQSVKSALPGLEINKINYKSTPDVTRDIVADLFGISSKKIGNNANLTKGEVREAQQFIFKNADLLQNMLPEGATASGTSTGVSNVLLKEFYDKTERAKMAKTGTKAGLPIQIKKNGISKDQFTEFFGIRPAGTANLSDRNTSAKVLALAKQTSKMMSNQAIRLELQNNGYPVKALQIIADGKSDYMFSRHVAKGTIEDKVALYKALPKLYDTYLKSGKNMESTFNKLIPDTFGKDRKKIIKDFERYITQYEAAKVNYDKAKVPMNMSVADFVSQELTENAMIENMKKLIGLGKGSMDFRNTQQLESVRSAVVKIAHKIGWEKAERFMPFLYASGKIGGTKLTSMYDGSGKLIEDAEFDLKLIKKGKRTDAKELESLRYGLFRGVADFKESVLLGLGGWNNDNINTLAADAKQSVGVDVSTPALARVNRDSANKNKDFLIELMDVSKSLIESGDITRNDFGMIMMSLAGDMRTPLAAAAHVAYTVDGKKSAKTHIYEHMIPRKVVGLYLADYALGKTSKADVKTLLNQFSVAILPHSADKIVGQYNKDSMPASWVLGADVLQRYYNMNTFGKINARLVDVTTGLPNAKAAAFADAADILDAKAKDRFKFSKAVRDGRSSNKKPKGITVLDFDDTLATSKSMVLYTAPNGTTGKLTAEEFAKQGADLLEQGYVYDFSEFNKVVKGKKAPLFEKALKLQSKFGNKDMFVLTARPAESAPSIFEFLQANGLNIPLENITGLANSTAEAKALWMADKVGEGYNDFYFADDALQNVQAVKNMLDQFDVKSKVQQAKLKFSRGLSNDFNNILEQTAKMPAEKRFSDAKAAKRGAKKNKFKLFVPYSHEDLTGMYYHFLGKGEVGNKQRDWFEKALIKPLNRAYTELNQAKQSIATDYKGLINKMPDVRKKLTQQTPDGDFTYGDAIRVALWNQAGYDVPGLSKTDNTNLVEYVEADPKLKSFADALSVISKQEEGYTPPNQYWLTEDIRSDLENATGKIGRSQFFQEWQENADEVFNPENLNKIEAVYGSNFREALEDLLYRTKTGNNRNFGSNRIVNQFMNFLNGSIGATMFFNARSAVLQTLSSVNFINYADNNIFKAGAAFANQPQFWKDFSYIFNSDTLKQRRGGLGNDLNASELTSYVSRSKSPVKAAINFMLQKGFLPTQIADSFAISSGGSTFYRNRIKKYEKEGFATKEAEQKAWTDFSEIAEATQQSARPDMISQQQASVLGRMILAFQNTPSQYNRLIKKAGLDLINRRKTKPYQNQAQSDMSNVSRILYYGAIQNLIFYSLQSALFAMMFDDDEEDKEFFAKKKDRIANSMIDGILRGSGVGGAVVSTVKNMVIKYQEQQGKTWGKDSSPVLLEALNISPPIGIKARKLVGAQKTMDYNKDVVDEMSKFNLENPVWSAVSNTVEATTNVPMARLYNKVSNVRAALDSNTQAWQRVALLGGWNRWDVGVDRPQSVQDAKEVVKEKKKEIRKEKNKIKKAEKKKEKEAEVKAIVEENKKKGKEDGLCAGVSKSGKRCKSKAVNGGFCTVHEKVKQNATGEQTQCKGKRTNGKRCGMKTSSASGYCYYHD